MRCDPCSVAFASFERPLNGPMDAFNVDRLVLFACLPVLFEVRAGGAGSRGVRRGH